MSPSDKAKELIELMWKSANINRYGAQAVAKKCVDQIIKELKVTTGHCTLNKLDWHEVKSDLQYWERVKNEIDKI